MRKRKPDRRPIALLLTLLSILLAGSLITALPGRGAGNAPTLEESVTQALERLQRWWEAAMDTVQAPSDGAPAPGFLATDGGDELVYEPPVNPQQDPNGHARQMKEYEADQRLNQAARMIQQGRSTEAIILLHRVLELQPKMPEAYVNMGFALVQQEKYQAALDFFEGALALNPDQANAYYGLGAAYEGLGELEIAIGAMGSFLHVVKPDDPANRFAPSAGSAIWEWEARLGRGPWGPDRGVPNGMTREQLLRDGGPVHGLRGKPGDTMKELRERYRREREADLDAQASTEPNQEAG